MSVPVREIPVSALTIVDAPEPASISPCAAMTPFCPGNVASAAGAAASAARATTPAPTRWMPMTAPFPRVGDSCQNRYHARRAASPPERGATAR